MVPLAAPDANVLVGNETHDDAGVYRLGPDVALVQTVDFFTPVVDDPALFGEIAAANSLSDIYATGARPLTALNLLAFPAGGLPPDVVGAMLNGGAKVLAESGTALLGGHSIDDPEPKMGYAVTGLVHPDHVWRNSTARPGDLLYLTKPIGTGVIIKAIKDGAADSEVAAAAISAMRTLNRAAFELLSAGFEPSACTDVTGYGLLGHLWEMAEGAGVGFQIAASWVPVLPGAEALARADGFPAGSRRNLEYVRPHLQADPAVPAWQMALFCDAVTSGGLLFTMDPGKGEALEAAAQKAHVTLHRLGTVQAGPAVIRLEV